MKDRLSPVSEARPSHHERLGVRPGVDAETLRQAFRRQSKALHPDTTQLPPEQASIAFQQLKESYDVLLRQSQATLSLGAQAPSSPPPLPPCRWPAPAPRESELSLPLQLPYW